MDRNFLFKSDNVAIKLDGQEAEHLTFEIKDSCVTGLITSHPDVIFSLLRGTILPKKGLLILAGIPVGEKYFNERRVSVLKRGEGRGKTLDMLVKSVMEYEDSKTELEELIEQSKQIKKDLLEQKKQADKADKQDIKIKIDKVDIATKTFELKSRHVTDMLKVEEKTAKGLYEGLIGGDEATLKKLHARLFAARFALARYTHGRMDEAQVKERAKSVIDELSLPADMDRSDPLYCIAEALMSAPQMIISRDSSLIPCAVEISQKTGIGFVFVSDTDAHAPQTVRIPERVFGGRQEETVESIQTLFTGE